MVVKSTSYSSKPIWKEQYGSFSLIFWSSKADLSYKKTDQSVDKELPVNGTLSGCNLTMKEIKLEQRELLRTEKRGIKLDRDDKGYEKYKKGNKKNRAKKEY